MMLFRRLDTTEADAIGIIPSKRRWERKQRARDRQVKFQGQGTPVSTVSSYLSFIFGLFMNLMKNQVW